MSPTKPVQLRLYTRHGCHLCEDMEQALQALAAELDFDTEIIPIDNNTDLERDYGSRVPLLFKDNEVICEYFLDRTALLQAVNNQ